MRLIDADALLSEVEKAYSYEDKRGQLGYTVSSIKKAPTIEAEPVRHGRWIEKRTIAYCSCCHVHWTKSFITSLRNTYKYCPNCGARMDGESKKEETVEIENDSFLAKRFLEVK